MTVEGSWILVVARSGLFLFIPVPLLATAVTPGPVEMGLSQRQGGGRVSRNLFSSFPGEDALCQWVAPGHQAPGTLPAL